MRIGNNGNVAIGTTDTATYKLNVNGTINATSILIGGSSIGSKWTASGTNIYYNSGNVAIGTTDTTCTCKTCGQVRHSYLHVQKKEMQQLHQEECLQH